MSCELEFHEDDSKALTDAELTLLMAAPLPSFCPAPRRASNACLICSQVTPNAGPFCSACQVTYSQSRDGVRR
jgi:hypothetical protein